MAKDYYNILGISRGSSAEEIKQAFRKLAHQYHPDKTGGDEKKFKEINEAYQILSDPEKRRQYDQFGTTFEHYQGQGGFSGFNGFRDFSGFAQGFDFDFSDLGDIFGDFFGGRRARKKTRGHRGSDIETQITIDLKEAALGAERVLELYKLVTCEKCQGSGAELGSKIINCPTCGGRGEVKKIQQTIIGNFQTIITCSTCGGEGKKREKNCSLCGGRGAKKTSKKIKIKIPAGIDNGEVIRLSGEGEAGERGGSSGDLYLVVRVKPHSQFKREGENLLTWVYLTVTQAALGDKIEVETINDKVRLKIPEGTQTGEIFRLRGKGIPRLKGFGRGDLLVEVVVKTPKNLSHSQKKILKELGI